MWSVSGHAPHIIAQHSGDCLLVVVLLVVPVARGEGGGGRGEGGGGRGEGEGEGGGGRGEAGIEASPRFWFSSSFRH